MDWPVILSAQPAKYLITEIEKFTSTFRAQLNVLPKQNRFGKNYKQLQIGAIYHYPKPQERPTQEHRAP